MDAHVVDVDIEAKGADEHHCRRSVLQHPYREGLQQRVGRADKIPSWQLGRLCCRSQEIDVLGHFLVCYERRDVRSDGSRHVRRIYPLLGW